MRFVPRTDSETNTDTDTDTDTDNASASATGFDIDIDHVFVIRRADAPLPPAILQHGLTEQYRRKHPGQGTANVCYAFDNLYLEILWIHDAAEATAPGIRRTGLLERSQWASRASCPFGIAWRRGHDGRTLPVSSWEFRPPYLPANRPIRVAVDSDDTRQPLLFEAPGDKAPLDWPSDRRGTLQHDSDLGDVTGITLTLANGSRPSPALEKLCNCSLLTVVPGTRPALELEVSRRSGQASVRMVMEPA